MSAPSDVRWKLAISVASFVCFIAQISFATIVNCGHQRQHGNRKRKHFVHTHGTPLSGNRLSTALLPGIFYHSFIKTIKSRGFYSPALFVIAIYVPKRIHDCDKKAGVGRKKDCL